MTLKNTNTRYGSVTKLLHWAIFILFFGQYTTATIMTWMDPGTTVFGVGSASWITWHKSLGLLILGLVLMRLIWRKTTRLPDWADGLAPWEKTTIHLVENGLYAVMILMPLSGMLMTAAAFLEGRRDDAPPSREEVAEALSGNLCRCTGYVKIIEAVQSAADEIAKETAR